jgi:hypothetical protein
VRGLIGGGPGTEPAFGRRGRYPCSRGRPGLRSGQGEEARRVLYYGWFREQRHEGAGPFRRFGYFPSHKAYIYRVEGGSGGRNEIPIELKKIMDRKSPDVPLMANDILYVPDATGARASLKVLETSVGIGAGSGAALIYVYH